MARRTFPGWRGFSVTTGVGSFAAVCFQLGLILAVVYRFEIEDQKQFFPMLCIAAGAFAIHAWLPLRWRASFFAPASWAGILLILGWENGSKVIGLGLGLVLLCHVPGPLLIRVILLVLAGAWLAAIAWRRRPRSGRCSVRCSCFG